MERLTTDSPQNNLQTALNLFYAKDGEAWVRGGGPEFAYDDVTLFTYIRSAIKHLALAPAMFEDMDNETLAEVLTEWIFDGHETMEGIVATLYTTAWAFAEIRARLKAYEDTGLTPEQVAALKQELVDERHRHDRLQDFEVDEAQELAALKEKCRWIPVTERLPEMHTKVLCCGRKGGRFIAELSSWGSEQHPYWTKHNGKGCSEVVWWMPLPESPEVN